MNTIPNKVIIWAGDDFNILGLLRELVPFGIDVLFLVKGKPSYASRSKYNKNMVSVSNNDEALQYLLKNFKQEINKPIILTSGDGIMVFIDQHKEVLEPYFILSGTKEKGLQEKYTDKNTMTELAEHLGIICPKSTFVNKNSDVTGWSYPCIIKPAHQKPGHYNEFKFKICKDESALKHTLSMVHPGSEFILQQYINKEHDILVYGARMMDGKTVVAGIFVKDRLADSGSSSFGHIYSLEDVPASIKNSIDIEKIALYLEKIDYKGLFSFEYGYVDGKSYFYEVNLRNDGTSHYFYQLGANIPLAFVYSCVGKDYSKIQTQVERTGCFIDEVFDIENVFHRRISIKQWKLSMKEADVFKYYSPEDQDPWKYVKKGRLKQMFQDIVLAKYRLYVVYLMDKFKR